ncbi:hypothetical protein [Kamptonema sp. UHCC 0994]|uniref:hypothetical protein n=1 Tax=Kamptonema sp. UHCC 0994 TaxID=3031329 RepID=UPI0023B94C2E|nr:hypothetical protein [Kamptonema sp. UHCC 0994]MDF0551855.1 hypothetical protein [Kamptonema sp. UHCC 0994]
MAINLAIVLWNSDRLNCQEGCYKYIISFVIVRCAKQSQGYVIASGLVCFASLAMTLLGL